MRPLLAFVPLRRAILLATAAISAAPPHGNQAAATSPETASKIEADLRRRAEEVRTDVAYPPAIIGEWQCARRIELIEGDVADAEAVYKSLGGSGGFQQRDSEKYATRFVPIRDARRKAAVVDRGYEYAARTGMAPSQVEWACEAPNLLRATLTSGASTSLLVLRRDLEPYDDEPPYGFGFTEVVRIVETRDGTAPPMLRTARLRRRLIPADDGSIEATEVISSFGTSADTSSAGVEASALPSDARPLSTTTSSFRLTRRQPARLVAQRAASPRMMTSDDAGDAGGDAGGDVDDAADDAGNDADDAGDGSQADDASNAASYPYDAEGLAQASFRFERRNEGGQSSGGVPIVDDVGDGLKEVADVGEKGLGIVALGLEIGLGGIFSPLGLVFAGLFAALVFSGDFGNTETRFLQTAEVTDESGYYRPPKLQDETGVQRF